MQWPNNFIHHESTITPTAISHYQNEQGTGTKSVKLIQFDISKIRHHFRREQIKLS